MRIKGKRIIAVAVALAMATQPVMAMAEETVSTETTAVQVEETLTTETTTEQAEETTTTLTDTELGEELDITLRVMSSKFFGSRDFSECYVDNNNNLWLLNEDENNVNAKVIRKNVKDFPIYLTPLSESSWHGRHYLLLDTENKLWVFEYSILPEGEATVVGESQLVEDVMKCDGEYALDEKAVLHNIGGYPYSYDENGAIVDIELIADVKDWVRTVVSNEAVVYILKNDGTLWTRKEVENGETLNTLTKADTDIKQILDNVYVKNDGKLFAYTGEEIDLGVETGVKEIFAIDIDENVPKAFYGTDGNFYTYWTGDEKYVNFGGIKVKDICYGSNGYYWYVLTEDGKVYKSEGEDVTLFTTGVSELNDKINGYYYPKYDNEAEQAGWWFFKSNDGEYLSMAGEKLSRVVLDEVSYTDSSGDYYNDCYLVLNSDGKCVIEKNGVVILDNVKQTLEGNSGCVLRTDGTIWDISGDVPVKVGDLRDGLNKASVVSGDVTGDDDVNISDLMFILNHVSGKSTLSGDAFDAGDVNGDGVIDLQDLMKILNFVSGKSKEL